MTEYDLCGWRVSSAIPLPELRQWEGAEQPAIVIAIGAVPESLADPVLSGRWLQIDECGRALHRAPRVADFLVEPDRITVDPHRAVDAPEIRQLLLGRAFGMLCHQRGPLPVHAGAVEIDGRGVAFAGPSGAGKSTLAAAFLRRGFPLFGDDVTPIEVLGEARFLAGPRRIRLWQDSAREVAWPSGLPAPGRIGRTKFTRAFSDGFVKGSRPAYALVHLRPEPSDQGPLLRRLGAAEAVSELRGQVYRLRALNAIAGEEGATTRLARAAGAIALHFELVRPFDYAGVDATIDAIVDAVRTVPVAG